MHEHEIRVKSLAVGDTLVTCALIAWVIGAASASNQSAAYGFVLICAGFAAMTVWPYISQGFSVAITELASFYVSISYLDILTGRVPHARVHPHGHKHDCPVCSHPPKPYRIRGVLDFVGYIFMAIPMIASTFLVKGSALFFGPLLYVGFAFRARDYTQLGFAARQRYRSSFKSVGVVLALIGIALFMGKVFLYSYWNTLAAWWTRQPLLSEFGPVIRPAAFLPFHITGVCASLLLIASICFIDSAIHSLEDRKLSPDQISGTLRTILILTRIRTVFSVYTWICFVWFFLPWLRRIHFPPVSLELFPRT